MGRRLGRVEGNSTQCFVALWELSLTGDFVGIPTDLSSGPMCGWLWIFPGVTSVQFTLKELKYV
ncbi:hypothetical protein [Leptospira weilii]|uniref:hypothetical protein n=1 Tax=Leptospira weilii TaxID=28184 RepID=UPI0012DACC6A|nr:hypothetical protein [Leptospira weilii]